MTGLLSNALLATVLAVLVYGITRVWRNPWLAYGLWLVVLLKLIIPPLIAIPFPIAAVEFPWTAAAPTPATAIREPSLPELGLVEELSSSTSPWPARGSPPANHLGEPRGQPDEVVEAATHPPAEQPMTGAQPRLLWRWLAAVWLAGSLLWIAVASWRIYRFHRLLAHTESASDDLNQLAQDVANRLGTKAVPRICVVSSRVSPMLWPVGRPTVVLAGELLTVLSKGELQSIVAHELAHIVIRGHWVRWLELLATAIYWWHPVLWLVRAELRNAEELCCDLLVIERVSATRPAEYAEALLKVAEFSSGMLGLSFVVDSRMSRGRGLKRRIEMVANTQVSRRLSRPIKWGVIALAVIVVPWSATAVDRGQADERKEPVAAAAEPEIERGEPATDRLLITPGTALRIRVAGTSRDQPISGVYLVEPSGAVALGPGYGRVKVADMTAEEAEAAIQQHLARTLRNPQVSVEHLQAAVQITRVLVPPHPYRISPGDVLRVIVVGTPPEEPTIAGTYLVEPGGRLAIGPGYGRVELQGLSLEGAEEAIKKRIEERLGMPVAVSVTLGGWEAALQRAPEWTRLSWQPSVAGEEELELLREHVKLMESQFQIVDSLHRVGAPGGETTNFAAAGRELYTARGNLALAGGALSEAMVHFQEARRYAEQGLEAAVASYEAGIIKLHEMNTAANAVLDAKLKELQIQRMVEASE